jgi:hypothetical protein
MACGIMTMPRLLLFAVPGTAAAQQSTKSHNTPTSLPQAGSPMAEVATQATEVTKLLRMWSAQVVPSPAIDTIHKVLPEASETIDLELAATSTVLQGQPTLELL